MIIRYLFSLLIPTLLWASLAGPSFAEEGALKTHFERGKTAYERGDYKAARKLFLSALKEDPDNKRARIYLRQVQATEKSGRRPVSIEKRLGKVIIDEVNLRQVRIADALAFVREKVSVTTKHKFKPNVILKKPSHAEVTLKLNAVPATELLRYIAVLSGHRVDYDPHAAVFTEAAEPDIAPVSAPVNNRIQQ